MPKFDDGATKIFKTLRPDDLNYRTAVTTAAREAENRWPLLKNALPKRFEETPDLTEQEKRNWALQKTAAYQKHNLTLSPALNKSSSNDRLAESLKRMARSKTNNLPTDIASVDKPLSFRSALESEHDREEKMTSENKRFTSHQFMQAENFAPMMDSEKTEYLKTELPLRSMFSRLSGGEQKADEKVVPRASILSKLSKR